MFIQDTDYLTRGINISFLMHFAVDLSVIQSFLQRKREESSTDDDDECTSNDDDYNSESTVLLAVVLKEVSIHIMTQGVLPFGC